MSLAIAEAARLRPHIRLAQAISEFDASLDKPQRVAFRNLRSQSPPTASSVIKLTEELNRQGSRAHKAWRPYATRLVVFLERVLLFVKAGDVLVGSTGGGGAITTGVWALLRISLEEAAKFLQFFQQLSEMFMRIGRYSEFQQDLVSLFPNCKEIQGYMCEYLIVLLQICRKLVSFGKKSLLSQLGSSQSLDAGFKTLETELQHWSARIDNKARFLIASSTMRAENMLERSSRALEFFSSDESRRAVFEERRLQLLHRLCPNQNRFERTWRRERKKGTVKWLFEHQNYLAWQSTPGSSLLGISGRLGSGKTVLMANMVGRLCSGQQAGSVLVASFFCRYDDEETLGSDAILDSIAHQLVSGLDAKEANSVIQRYDANGLNRLDKLADLALLLPRGKTVFVIIDALDECRLTEAEAVLASLKKLTEVATLKLCFSSRTGTGATLGSMGKALFAPHWGIEMAGQTFADELNTHIEAEVERRAGIRTLTPELRNLVRSTLVAAAQGMYLWVSLQMETLFPRYRQSPISDSDIVNILNTLPLDLRASFDRALATITNQVEGRKLFKIVAAAIRPLGIDELRVALNVQVGNENWTRETLIQGASSRQALSSLSGGLIELDEEDGSVHYIHHSALQHLCGDTQDLQGTEASPGYHFTELQAEGLLADICVTYLSLDIHNTSLIQKSNSVDDIKALRAIQTTITNETGTTGRLLAYIIRRRSAGSAAEAFDLVQVLQHELHKLRADEEDPKHLLDYASQNFLKHTSSLDVPMQTRSESLFLRLLKDSPPHIGMAGESFSYAPGSITWAASLPHERALYLTLKTGAFDILEVADFMELASDRPEAVSLRGKEFGHLLGYCLETLYYHMGKQPKDYDAIDRILQWGAAPDMPFKPKLGIPYISFAADPTPISFALRVCEKRWAKSAMSEVIESLLKHGAVPHPDDIRNTISSDWLEGLKLLLKYHNLEEDYAWQEETLISYAIRLRSDEAAPFVHCLLGHGVPPDPRFPGTALIQAIKNQHVNVAKVIIANHKTSLDYLHRGVSPLLMAVRHCHDLVPPLVESGADIEYPNFYFDDLQGTTLSPLALAMDEDNAELISLFVRSTSAAGRKDRAWRQRALMSSIQMDKVRILQFLCSTMSAGEVEKCRHPSSRRSVVQLAAEKANPDIIRRLESHGVNLWAPHLPASEQPFIIALHNGNVDTAQTVLILSSPSSRSLDEVKWGEVHDLAEAAGFPSLVTGAAKEIWDGLTKHNFLYQ